MRLVSVKIILLLLIALPVQALSQDYAVWKYSSQTLDFNQEPPFFSSDANYPSGYYNSSICDRTGRLRVYTSTDSTIHFLSGDNSEMSQTGNSLRNKETYGRYNSGLIRLNDSIVYHFYTAALSLPQSPAYWTWYQQYLLDSVGLFMTVINMAANGGLGSVLPGQKDVRVSPVPHGTIAFHLNADSTWWIVSECRDSLYAYKLLRNGMMLPPVISALNELQISRDSFILNPATSEMRFSHDGAQLIRASHWRMRLSPNKQSNIYSYHFDETSGLVSKQKLIEKQIINGPSVTFNCTDIVFAPNDSLFYLIFSNHPTGKNVVQYNRYSPDLTSSAFVVHYSDLAVWGGIIRYAELGQNSKIYLSTDASDYSIIYRPNKSGKECHFLLNRMPVNCSLGLGGNGCSVPDFPYSRFHGYRMDFTYSISCDSILEVTNFSDTISLKDFQWFLYGPGGYLDSIEATNPHFAVKIPGYYWLKFRGTSASGYRPWFSDSVLIEFPDVPKARFVLSKNEGCRYVDFSIKDSSVSKVVHPDEGQKWIWNFGDGTDTTINTGPSGDVQHVYHSAGNFVISLIYSNGYCSDSIASIMPVTIEDAPRPGLLSNNQVGCLPLEISFSDQYVDPLDSVVLDFGDGQRHVDAEHITEYAHTFMDTGTFTVYQYLYGTSGCVSMDSLSIHVLQGFMPNQNILLAYTTLSNSGGIETRWKAAPYSRQYVLERRTGPNMAWNPVYSGSDTAFIDADISPLIHYHYRVKAYDTCDVSILSNEGGNIVLMGKNVDNNFSDLIWNDYYQWVSGVDYYEIYEIDPQSGSPLLKGTSTQAHYQDIDFFHIKRDSLCYQVVAYSSDPEAWTSTSNVACVRYIPTILIPNSFSPNNDGLNEVFIPVTSGIRDENYELVIYDRWGEVIFRTTSKHEGWDGTFRSQDAQIGLYFYRLSYASMDISGRYSRTNLTGSILLLR